MYFVLDVIKVEIYAIMIYVFNIFFIYCTGEQGFDKIIIRWKISMQKRNYIQSGVLLMYRGKGTYWGAVDSQLRTHFYCM